MGGLVVDRYRLEQVAHFLHEHYWIFGVLLMIASWTQKLQVVPLIPSTKG
jgi:hypothetical protein